MSIHLLPPPLLIDGELALPCEIASMVVDGAFGECVACRRTCWSWWSPNPPSGYVALHRDRCPARLRELWAEAEGVPGEPEPAPIVARGRGAYGRRTVTAASRQAERTSFVLRRGIELPQDFTPGPFWKPGYSHLEPWVVLFQSGSGGGHAPFHRNEKAARAYLRGTQARRMIGYADPVVGAVLLAPDGARADEWGDPPVPGRTRWVAISQLSEWRRCAGCSAVRWPGSWMTVLSGRCRACQEPDETADPRPWPPDPPDPGLATAPDYLGGPKRAKKRAVGIS